MRQRLLRGVGLLGLFAGAVSLDAQPRAAAGVGIDHLILGVDDLERGMEEFARRTGVTPIKGGVHPGRGTQNALASLGNGQYVEILAPSNEAGTMAPSSTSHRTLTAVGWALHSNDLTSVVGVVRGAGFMVSEIRAGARSRPDGVKLSWQTATVGGTGLDAAPFFISWGAATPHPSTESPTGCRLASVALREPDPAPLQRFLATVKVVAGVTQGASQMTVVLMCPTGSVKF
jgi:hypothetical protein